MQLDAVRCSTGRTAPPETQKRWVPAGPGRLAYPVRGSGLRAPGSRLRAEADQIPPECLRGRLNARLLGGGAREECQQQTCHFCRQKERTGTLLSGSADTSWADLQHRRATCAPGGGLRVCRWGETGEDEGFMADCGDCPVINHVNNLATKL